MHRVFKLCAFFYIGLFRYGHINDKVCQGEAAAGMNATEFIVCKSAVLQLFRYINLTLDKM